MNTHTLSLDLGDRSYPILIGKALLRQEGLLSPYLGGDGILIVTNETIGPLYLDTVTALLAGRKADHIILPDGEQYKNLETLNLIFSRLLECSHNRDTTLIALGGGVIGDMTGFAAACYQRGVDFIQIPTTLLAQVDSSVGGKTAVNHALGKNMIGAFHQPKAVLIDIETLETLPEREYRAGLAEVIKYGLIIDDEFFCWLEEHASELLGRQEQALSHAIEVSCRLKAKVVSADEREGGIRAILNLGHTFGHAIETQQGYNDWLHGEAVAAGMVMAARMSQRLGWLLEPEVARIESLVTSLGLPCRAPENIGSETYLEHMSVDKKARGGKIRLVLLKAIGEAVVTADYPQGDLVAVLNQASI
ncbi:MAG TPA: 3-dehydroquinate synthase [Porticoccaceae bacterium]|nr:3-dehydroquinate synthase [Porticoccaceae bacterium]